MIAILLIVHAMSKNAWSARGGSYENTSNFKLKLWQNGMMIVMDYLFYIVKNRIDTWFRIKLSYYVISFSLLSSLVKFFCWSINFQSHFWGRTVTLKKLTPHPGSRESLQVSNENVYFLLQTRILHWKKRKFYSNFF